MEKTGTLLD